MDLNISLRRPRRSAPAPSSPSTGSGDGGPGKDPQQPPLTLDWLLGTWHVTHSTLPMWKWKMAVRITYSATTPRRLGRGAVTMGDLVEYQEEGRDEVKQIRGVDTAVGNDVSMWKWRGRGLLFLTTSAWEILGHGTIPPPSPTSPSSSSSSPSSASAEGTTPAGQGEGGEVEGVGGTGSGGGSGGGVIGGGGSGETVPAVANQWVVTYFEKTWFTPAGIDIYSRHPDGLSSEAVASIRNALAQVDDAEIQALSQGLFALF